MEHASPPPIYVTRLSPAGHSIELDDAMSAIYSEGQQYVYKLFGGNTSSSTKNQR